jgi:hypothetical protein
VRKQWDSSRLKIVSNIHICHTSILPFGWNDLTDSNCTHAWIRHSSAESPQMLGEKYAQSCFPMFVMTYTAEHGSFAWPKPCHSDINKIFK